MHPKRKQLDALFDRWILKYPPDDRPSFHRDGIIDEYRFYAEEHRLLFILKEPNSQGNQYFGLDLREVFAMDGTKPIYSTLGSWAGTILDGDSEYRRDRRLSKNLQRVAIANLKKLAGTSASRLSVIREYAERDSEFLREQLAIIEPTVIMACGSGMGPLVRNLLSGDERLARIPLIELPHPSFRGNREQAFADILSQVQRLGVGTWKNWKGAPVSGTSVRKAIPQTSRKTPALHPATQSAQVPAGKTTPQALVEVLEESDEDRTPDEIAAEVRKRRARGRTFEGYRVCQDVQRIIGNHLGPYRELGISDQLREKCRRFRERWERAGLWVTSR